LSEAERVAYINAVYEISTNPQYKTAYNNLVTLHTTYFYSGIHDSPMFFPWHRQYIWAYENLLQQVDCRITVPYWRWSLEATAPFSSTVWDASDGVGGNGLDDEGCVTNGLFSGSWVTPVGICLSRAWISGSTFATEADISEVIDSECSSSSDYDCVEQGIENFHNYVHASIMGQMGGIYSANDPIFFLHHGYIDYMWNRWQSTGTAFVEAYSTTQSTSTALPGFPSQTIADWINPSKQGNNASQQICYIDPPNLFAVEQALDPTGTSLSSTKSASLLSTTSSSSSSTSKFSLQSNSRRGYRVPTTTPCVTPQRLQAIPRIPLGPFPEAFLKNMGMSDAQIAAKKAIHDYRNTNYTIISVDYALNSSGLTPQLGIVLDEQDFSCMVNEQQTLIVT